MERKTWLTEHNLALIVSHRHYSYAEEIDENEADSIPGYNELLRIKQKLIDEGRTHKA